MIIGIPKEIKNHEYRVGAVPEVVQALIARKHQVLVEQSAGLGIGINDDEYRAVGAEIVSNASEIFNKANLIIKVKEPQPEECKQLQPGQTLFTFLHLAADPLQADLLMQSGCNAIAYETITDEAGRLPVLAPMSEVAGRVAVQAGAHFLERQYGGRGILLGGVTGVKPAKVVIIGGGHVGTEALKVAVGMGADVTIIDKSEDRLKALATQFNQQIHTLQASEKKLSRSADGCCFSHRRCVSARELSA